MTQLHLGVAAAAHCGFTPRYCLFMGRTVARLAEVDFMTAMYDLGPLRLCIAILLSVAVFFGKDGRVFGGGGLYDVKWATWLRLRAAAPCGYTSHCCVFFGAAVPG